MLKYTETKIIEIEDEITSRASIRLLVKCEYQNHPFVSGNKWWKLKYNIEEALNAGHQTVLTFGGAFSNHIFATAAAAKDAGLKSIGIIRGEEVLPLNETLAFAKQCGMALNYVSREKYRLKTTDAFIASLHEKHGNFFLIPEGGTNLLALKGCSEFAHEKLSSIHFDYLCLPVGTGGTMAGIVAGFEGSKNVIGFSVLKNGGFLNEEVAKNLKEFSGREFPNWRIETNYDFGGYAKSTIRLGQFISEIKERHKLPLDFVYTGKMMTGIYDMIELGKFPRGSIIMALHTGGLRN